MSAPEETQPAANDDTDAQKVDAVITAALLFLQSSGAPPADTVSGALAAIVRFHIETTAEAGQPVFARDVMGAFIGPVQKVADLILKQRAEAAAAAVPEAPDV